MSEHAGAVIRLYQPADRPTVRRLAWETADRVALAPAQSLDPELLADLLTGYYLRWEPQATWVAEADGQLIGYLTGCLNERRYARLMSWRVVPGAVWRAWMRGRLRSLSLWRRTAAWLLALRRQEMRRVPRPYPAHLHVNLDARFRQQGIGQRLVERFLAQARSAGVAGVCAGVRAENAGARRFFERLGFTPALRQPALFAPETIVYAKTV